MSKYTTKLKRFGEKSFTTAKALPMFVLGLFTGSFNFFKSSAKELRTVTWLSRKDTVRFSVTIILFIILSAVSIGLTDLGLFRLIGIITSS